MAIHTRADVLPVLAEVFREHGFDGASLSLISERTGLGKGSLYHFFPGGKEEMAAAVLKEVDHWFNATIFKPLRQEADSRHAIGEMFRAVDDYFHSGQRMCLVGVIALGDSRDLFAAPIKAYFVAWTKALATALQRDDIEAKAAKARAEETVAAIQGALVLARALDDTGAFRRLLQRLEVGLLSKP